MTAVSLSGTTQEINLAGIQADLLFAEAQVGKTVASLASSTSFPRSGGDVGHWSTVGAGDWTSGFFPGELWLLYQATGDTKWRDAAGLWTNSLASQAARTDTHDIGFMIGSSFGNGYRLTGDLGYQVVLQQAAASLASRYDSDVGAMRSWSWGSWSYPVIIDNMMNLTPLVWGAGHGGNPAWTDIAIAHANTTIKNIVRSDGSTFHLADFDPATGALIRQETYQGYNDNSTWARGQAWAIHGFTEIYQATKVPAFLAAAQSTANHFLSHLPSDAVPYWDFSAPVTATTPRDTSAAAIAASALTELSTLVEAPADQQSYLTDALKILGSLSSTSYLGSGQGDAILRHATGGKTFEVDTSLIYGDYYFTEGLLRAQAVLSGKPLWTQYNPEAPAGGLVLSMAEDAWQGDAQFTMSLDGVQVGGVLTATASRSAGQSQAFTVSPTLSPGTHVVGVTFTNDAWGGSASTDRNLYLTSAAYNGQAIAGSTAPLHSNGTASFGLTVPGQTVPPPPITGLVVSLSEDPWQGDAQFTISIDGQQVGGVRTVTALHAAGQSQAFAVNATLAAGTHQVGIAFINDAWGGSASTDRNLFLTGATYNGQAIAGSTATLFSNGTASFDVATPGQTPTVLSTLVLNVSEDAWLGDAQFTVKIDGQQSGGTYTATASHGAGQSQAITIANIAETFSPHDIAISFVNDAWGGSASTDRNLYVNSVQFDGRAVPGGSAALYDGRTQHFTVAAPANWIG